MCAVSAVHDNYSIGVPLQQWTRPLFNEYQDIIARLDALDKKLGQKECEDPSKAAWMREVEKRLSALEGRAE
jgi:hypothetical protein